MDAAIDTLRRRIPLIAICVLLAVGAAAIIAMQSGDSYRATARLFVGTSAQDITSASQGDIAAKSRVRTYQAIATSEDLFRVAARKVPGTTPEELAKNVVVSSPPDTALLDVAATASTPDLAAAQAQAVSDQLVGLVAELEKPIRSGGASIGLVNLQSAANGVTKVPRFDPITLAVYGVGGLIVGLAIALLIPWRVRLLGKRGAK